MNGFGDELLAVAQKMMKEKGRGVAQKSHRAARVRCDHPDCENGAFKRSTYAAKGQCADLDLTLCPQCGGLGYVIIKVPADTPICQEVK